MTRLRRNYATPEDLQCRFAQGVGAIFAPFNPGNIEMMVRNDLSPERVVQIDIPVLKNDCTFVVDLLDDPYKVVDYMLGKIKEHYDRSYVPPESHIQLSTN